MFDSRSFDTRSFDSRSWDFGVDVVVEQRPSGHFSYAVHLRRYDKKTPEEIHAERVKLGIFKADEIDRAESFIAEIIERRKTDKALDVEAELKAAEQAFKDWLESARREWTKEYILLLAASYAKLEQENVDAQIVLLLWDM